MKRKNIMFYGLLAVTIALSACSASAQGEKITGADERFSFTKINSDTEYSISKGTATLVGTVNIPAYYRPTTKDTYIPVTTIAENGFQKCGEITKITVPSTVKTIGKSAFSNCSGLTSISIPVGVTSIGNNAFDGCTSLTSISIPAGVTSISNYAFSGCTNLTSIDIPNSVTSIGQIAFTGCRNLASVTIPAGVTSIGNTAFGDCTSLTSITIPAGVTTIEYGAFVVCTNLVSVTFEGNAITGENFGSDAFPQGSNGYGNNVRTAYRSGGAGTYTRDAGGTNWTKQ